MKIEIPREEIPGIIIHWKVEAYPNTSVSELRNFLEPRLRAALFDASVVAKWTDSAKAWQKSQPRLVIDDLFADYNRVRRVA